MPIASKSARKKSSKPTELITNPVDSARAAGLRYVTDTQPGFHRHGPAKSFRYTDAADKPLRDKDALARIKSLVIPPAWADVWVCAHANGHLQATGRDARGRKQGRYHPRWREVRDETKYDRMALFAEKLPLIRRRIEHDLTLPGLPREKVLATIVNLMEATLIRVGNEEYARTNKSYGLTTLRNRHVEVHGSTVTFTFKGKSGVHHTINLHDRRLASVVKRIADIPGYELFQYLDADGTHHSIDSSDVNAYLHEIAGEHITAKDFRTWAGSVLACLTLLGFEPFTSATQAKKNVVAAVTAVAARLGNTPSVCRKCYIHPAVLEAYMARESISGTASVRAIAALTTDSPSAEREAIDIEIAEHTSALHKEEHILLDLLAQRAKLASA